MTWKDGLSDLEKCVVLSMEGHKWVRPMDIGGSDGSHHSATLKRLIRRGIVERKKRGTITNVLMVGIRGSYVYRLTDEFAESMRVEREKRRNRSNTP